MMLAGSILLAASSCSLEERDNLPHEEQVRVPVSLSLSVAGMEAGTPETKAIMEPDNPDDIDNYDIQKEVKNLVVLQFEGEGRQAKLVALPEYYNDAAAILSGAEQVRLLPTNKPSIIAVVANTFDNIHAQSGMTLGQFLEMDYSRITEGTSVFTTQDGFEYLRMSGSCEVTAVDTNTPVEISLKRNVSKITIHVTNNTGEVTLNQVQLRDINAKYYYLTNIEAQDAVFVDRYSSDAPSRFDKEPDAWAGGTSQTFTYYVPANLRGKTNSTAQYSKGLGAPEGATRFCLLGSYGSGTDKTAINYTYYLGENLTNDFNLKPKNHYTYNITLESKGDARYDYRIEDCKKVTFLVDANCYMVQPPLGEGQSRTYAIPIRRAAVFWNKEGEYNGVYGGNQVGQYSNVKIENGSEWTADVLWSDFPLVPSEFLTKSTGTGFNPAYQNQDPYFEITVKAGMKGNAVIAVRIGTGIVWSWHIWITDYNPDREALNKVNDVYIYGVDGGNIHRYKNNTFDSNEHMFIMDRNLGASGAAYGGLNGEMFYQFGRKDPFLAYNQEGKLNTVYTYTGDSAQETTINTVMVADTGSENVVYTVSFPQNFIITETSTTWTNGSALVDAQKKWLDKKIDEHGTQSALTFEKGKSIYDPCPPGWKVPDIEAFSFSTSSIVYGTNGLLHVPKESESIYFPAHSYRSGQEGAYSVSYMNKGYGYLWSADPYENGTSASRLRFILPPTEETPYSISTAGRSNGFPVRCTREEAYVKENYIAD